MTKNKFKPILFKTELVQAILNGTKTQTRREIKKKYSNTDLEFKTDKYGTRLIERQNDVPPPIDNGNGTVIHRMTAYAEVKPKYKIGDILWVRETFIHWNGNYQYKPLPFGEELGKWKPSIHMPKVVARIFLKITNVRCERLKDITEGDAIAEGIDFTWYDESRNIKIESAKKLFFKLWIDLFGNENFNQNPYVFVYEFEKIEKPLDFI